MIKVFKTLFKRKEPLIIPAAQHKINKKEISASAIEIIEKLQQKGFHAYIVGGAVRDLLLGFHPKDFDIATDAKPEEMQQLFRRRSRIIGRRFPILHIYPASKRRMHYADYIEVTTFRGTSSKHDSRKYYGNACEDAKRRDFTINGLFYDPISGDIYDYINGTEDIRHKKLRMIGKINKRLPEDPVRILRALRLSTKLGLIMHNQLEEQLANYAHLLADIPNARLFDELIKIVNCGAGTRVLQQWQQFGVCDYVMPILQDDNPMFFSVMAENDRRIAEKTKNSLSFALAALFWQKTAALWHHYRSEQMSPVQAMERAIANMPFGENKIIPQRLIARIKDIYFMQAKMENAPTLRRTKSIMDNKIFDYSLAFAAVRQDAGAAQTVSWWSQFSQGTPEERERMIQNAPQGQRRKRRRRRASKQAV